MPSHSSSAHSQSMCYVFVWENVYIFYNFARFILTHIPNPAWLLIALLYRTGLHQAMPAQTHNVHLWSCKVRDTQQLSTYMLTLFKYHFGPHGLHHTPLACTAVFSCLPSTRLTQLIILCFVNTSVYVGDLYFTCTPTSSGAMTNEC